MRKSQFKVAAKSSVGTTKNRSENTDRTLFRVLAKHRFPRKTAPAVRVLTGYSESTIYDWLKGKSAAPFDAYVALLSARRHGG